VLGVDVGDSEDGVFWPEFGGVRHRGRCEATEGVGAAPSTPGEVGATELAQLDVVTGVTKRRQ
jgi:hypothetical protein